MAQNLSPGDPSSFSRPDLVAVTHMHLFLNASFEQRVLSGYAKLKFKKLVPHTKDAILDIKDLIVHYVHDITNQDVKYTIGETIKDIGTKLSIDIENQSESFELTIGYETSPNASGLQWLTPQQTSGKIHPFMFSQGQPTEMRSIIPCQDTPSNKIPYSAEIKAPKDLIVLMSALRVDSPIEQSDGTRIHRFNQPVAMATYLIAIAIGALESKTLSKRSHVWAEKELVDKAAYEFAETEQMLLIAESICGPYVWTIYDLLVLPPSFPYGGMENPCLTFVTPSLLAGDRSLADVIAHEISHSWTGNLVTNSNFEHFWLNEGFTTFVERKIGGQMHGAANRDFVTLVGFDELRDTISIMGETNPLTKLVVNLTGIHPDEAFSRVPYEKGSIFLRYLEECVGGEEKFEEFLKSYIKQFAYKSITTDVFKNYFMAYFKDTLKNEIDWDSWLYSPGLPKYLPSLNDSNIKKISDITQHWKQYDKLKIMPKSIDTFSTKVSTFTTNEYEQFLNQLIDNDTPLSVETLKTMNELYKFEEKTNSEIKSRWLRLCLRAGWIKQVPAALEFVNSIGRMKYLTPIYRELYNNENTRQQAIDNFNRNKHNYMLVAQKAIEHVLQPNSKSE